MSEKFLNDYEKNRNKIYHMHDNKSDLDVDDAFEIIKEDGRNINDKTSDVDSKIEDVVNSDNSEIIDIDDPYLLDKEYREAILSNGLVDLKRWSFSKNAVSLASIATVFVILFSIFGFIYLMILAFYLTMTIFTAGQIRFVDYIPSNSFFIIPLVISIIITIFIVYKNKLSKDELNIDYNNLKYKIKKIDDGKFTFMGIGSKDIDYKFIKENIQKKLSEQYDSSIVIAKRRNEWVLVKYLDIDNDTDNIDLDKLDSLIVDNKRKIDEFVENVRLTKNISISILVVSVLLFSFLVNKYDLSHLSSTADMFDIVVNFIKSDPFVSIVLISLMIISIVTNITISNQKKDELYIERVNLLTIKQRSIEKNENELD